MKIVNVMASSLDGRIAFCNESDAERMAAGFINEADHDRVEGFLRKADAVICGGQTLRSAGKIWDVSNEYGCYPRWYVFTKKGFPKESYFFGQQHVPLSLVSPTLKHDPVSHVEMLAYGSANPAKFLYDHMAKQGLQYVVLFGGGFINSLFYEQGLVGELHLTLSPLLIGSSAPGLVEKLPTAVKLNLDRAYPSANHIFLSYSCNYLSDNN